MRSQKWAAKEPSLLFKENLHNLVPRAFSLFPPHPFFKGKALGTRLEFAVYRIWTFERVWFSELVACVAEALLSPFSAPFLCRFPACYEEWRIGVGPKKNLFFFSPFKKRERERARTREISRQFYDEMKAWSRLKSVFCALLRVLLAFSAAIASWWERQRITCAELNEPVSYSNVHSSGRWDNNQEEPL